MLGLLCAALVGCAGAQEAKPSAAPAAPAAPVAVAEEQIRIDFDYSAAQLMAATVGRTSLSEAEARALLDNRGIWGTVKKTGVFIPSATPDDFVRDMRLLVEKGAAPENEFDLHRVREARGEIEALVATLRANEAAIAQRMTARLVRYAPETGPVAIKVYFVAGGRSDGFMLVDDPEPAFFVALDKARGDADGVEQNMTHELYHVLQKVASRRSPEAAAFAASVEQKPPVPQMLATTLVEGTANFVADARETQGLGPYASMWRERYVKNHEPARMRENFALFDEVLADLSAGRTDWRTAYRRAFAGEGRLYFVGMEMARALAAAHGPTYFKQLFTRPPSQFFRDYLALSARDAALMQFAAATRVTIEGLPAEW